MLARASNVFAEYLIRSTADYIALQEFIGSRDIGRVCEQSIRTFATINVEAGSFLIGGKYTAGLRGVRAIRAIRFAQPNTVRAAVSGVNVVRPPTNASVRRVYRGTSVAPTRGTLTGNINNLSSAEKRVVNDLVNRGNKVEIIPKDPRAINRTPDFRVNGVSVELKTLQNPNVNTGITRVQDGFKQNAQNVLIDARDLGLTRAQGQEIINRARGTFSNGKLPGKVEIWTSEGIVIGF